MFLDNFTDYQYLYYFNLMKHQQITEVEITPCIFDFHITCFPAKLRFDTTKSEPAKIFQYWPLILGTPAREVLGTPASSRISVEAQTLKVDFACFPSLSFDCGCLVLVTVDLGCVLLVGYHSARARGGSASILSSSAILRPTRKQHEQTRAPRRSAGKEKEQEDGGPALKLWRSELRRAQGRKGER